ncbi:hypothetical protein SAMN05443287_10431 [Micromonospora phaseoli]|uniref:Uncharacterized protein n=1 Tax=Micromonospora phaseoli TaxID=1144548 RepID=A0A1H6YEN6_9ACTN|nr:hypothetical protein [Micromonospora phaseoli]PZW00004.1 hypothetical protein CLV64_10330 [Micromonospora phaseoli]GIJ80456.1 hypothetical protein Xph01_48880 [Micromonospora phaseoli]SEJ35650.1 hypothetical protein SAMN05443287_10431 [Micromonospora phaseoli]
MCVDTAIRADIRVSIQDRRASDRAAGHLAVGVLIDGDQVLVPNPPKELLDPHADLEVVVFPAGLQTRLPVEVAPVWKWRRFALTDAAPLAVIASLGRTSGYSAQIGRADATDLAKAIDGAGGDLWEALRRQQVVGADVHLVDDDLLRRAGELEHAQREPRVAEHRFGSLRELTGGFCILFCFCEPHGSR